MTNFRNGIISSLFLVGESVANKLIGLVSTLILARVLLPEDFGIVAIATLVVGFFEILAHTGSTQYLLRAKLVSDSDVNTAWTINLLLRGLLSSLIILSSFFVELYYDDPRLQPVLIALTIVYFFDALQNPGVIHLKREQKYNVIVKVSLLSKFIAVGLAIWVAVFFESYWALVISQAASKIVMLVGLYMVYPYKPICELTNAKKQWTFSGWILPQAILGYFRTQLDTFWVGSSFGKSEVGSYHTMKYLAFIPTSHLILPMTEILIVELRKASIDSSYFTQMFNASLLVALAIAIPASTFISTFHEMTTLMLLGDNWIEYSELFAAFALLITSAAIHQHCSKVLVIFDKPKHLFIYEIATFILVYGTLYLVGLKSLSIFIYVRVGLEQAFSVLFLFYVSLKYTNFRALVSLIFGVAGILLGAYIAAKCADYVVDIPSNLILSFFSVGAIFVLVYVVCLVVLYISFFKKLREWVYIHSLLMRVLNPLIQKIQAM